MPGFPKEKRVNNELRLVKATAETLVLMTR